MNVDPYENIPQAGDPVPVVDAVPQPVVSSSNPPNGSAGAGEAVAAPTTAAPATSAPAASINEDDLYGSPDEVDPNASVADLPPPAPDGWYLMKCSIHSSNKKHFDTRLGKELPGELKSYTDKQGTKKIAYKINIGLECVDDGPQKGKKAVLFADSFIFGGTSFCDDVVGAIYGKKLEQRNIAQLRDSLLKGLAGEPVIGVRREWQAVLENRQKADGSWLKDTETIVRRGMDSFPKDASGKPIPLRSVPSGPHKDEPCRTNSEIVQVAHRSQVPRGTSGTAGGSVGSGGTPSAGSGVAGQSQATVVLG